MTYGLDTQNILKYGSRRLYSTAGLYKHWPWYAANFLNHRLECEPYGEFTFLLTAYKLASGEVGIKVLKY